MGIRHFSTQIKSVFLTSDQNWILGFSPKSLLVVVQFYCLKQIGMKGHLVLLEKEGGPVDDFGLLLLFVVLDHYAHRRQLTFFQHSFN